ncbi:MAG: hypothetical protein KF685_12145 [Acidobacteria bacterium]|nr:hypothetical protein [Acidobacteriota bacterium]
MINIISSMVIAFAFAVFFVDGVNAQEFGKDELIKASKFLEEKPFDKNAKNIRSAAFVYAADTKEVTVIICGGEITKHIMDKKNKNGSELLAQYAIGMTAFKLENPDNNDENAAQLAGLESVLKTYEAMIAEKPKTNHKGMDEYVQKRNNSELKALVDAADCGKK